MECLFYELSIILDELHLSENRIMMLKLKSLWGTFTLSAMGKSRGAEEHTGHIEINSLSKEE